jgi:hypothetical protein
MSKSRVVGLAISIASLAAVVISVFASSRPAALTTALSQLAPSSIVIAALFLTAGLLLSALRFKLITADLGYSLSIRDATMTLSVGQLVGNLFNQLAGQLIGRGAVLARRGIPPAASVMISGYERIFALCVSLVLAVGGASYLFGKLSFDLQAGGMTLVKLALGLSAAVAAGAAVAWGQQAAMILRQITPALALRLMRSTVISLAIQLTTLAAYVVAGHALAPHINYISLAAAACVIMFAASLPISLGGWGMREMSAVVALQAIGLPGASALLLALLIGVLSIIVVGLAAVMLTLGGRKASFAAGRAPAAPAAPDYTLLLDWIMPIAAATAVFFQIYVPAGSGAINVNLADPVALIGAALFCLRHVGHGWPAWRVRAFNIFLLAATAVIGLSYLHGVVTFGWTNWAFANRLLGWPVLLCYLVTGALITLRGRENGLLLLLATFAATGAAIAALELSIVALAHTGLPSLDTMVDRRIIGFSQNPNAFSFVLLMALAAALTLQDNLRWRSAIIAALVAGLYYADSRIGLLAVPMMIGAALISGITLRPLLNGLAAAGVILLALGALGALAGADASHIVRLGGSGDQQHLLTLLQGWHMFLSHPLFGAGLGAYMNEQLQSTGVPLVIHSTAVWLLAETGLAGFAVFAFAGWRIFAAEFSRRHEFASRAVVLFLIGFGTMAQLHDMLYQRALWLLLGAALAAGAQCAAMSIKDQ